MEGTELRNWVCPICKRTGRLRLKRLSEDEHKVLENSFFKTETHYGEAENNAFCLDCKFESYVIRVWSY